MKKSVVAAKKASIYATAKNDDEIKQIAIETMAIRKFNGKKNGETIWWTDNTSVAYVIKLRSITGKSKPFGSSRATLYIESRNGWGIMEPNPCITKMTTIAASDIGEQTSESKTELDHHSNMILLGR